MRLAGREIEARYTGEKDPVAPGVSRMAQMFTCFHGDRTESLCGIVPGGVMTNEAVVGVEGIAGEVNQAVQKCADRAY